jgi:acetyl-CoA carboxylase biotin carboxyl carrier protein
LPIINNISNIPPSTKAEEPKGEIDYSKHSGALLSPMVGVIYTAPNVDAKNFVSVGDSVNQGDTVLLIEAMKVFNPIKANKDGKISKILVKANQAVEFNQPLIIIE